MQQLAIIGGGPAGLRAAEVASAAGLAVTLYEGKRSVGRKFLVAGKGGFNITHAEPLAEFVTRYQGPGMPSKFWGEALAEFDNEMMRGWAARLGVGTFVAGSGRVYPKALKAAPLLRAWLRRLREQGVTFKVNHRLTKVEPGSPHQMSFETGGEVIEASADGIIFATGGGSWPQTGSDGRWMEMFSQLGIETHPLSSANCGWEVDWSPEFLAQYEGEALKNLVLRVGQEEARGELVITNYGLEGGPIYKLGPALRAMEEPTLEIDFKPTLTQERMVAKMESARRDFIGESQARWKFSPAAGAILEKMAGPFSNAEDLARIAKNCPLPLKSPRPLAEAISSAGGVKWDQLDAGLMLAQHPGLFVAGEMIDWEAPTGGYLMQGCFASGTRAAQSALQHLAER